MYEIITYKYTVLDRSAVADAMSHYIHNVWGEHTVYLLEHIGSKTDH